MEVQIFCDSKSPPADKLHDNKVCTSIADILSVERNVRMHNIRELARDVWRNGRDIFEVTAPTWA